MELYKDLVLLRCFSRDTLLRLTGSKESADWWIRKYLERNYIGRIRRDLYAVIKMLRKTHWLADGMKATDSECDDRMLAINP